MSTTHNCDLCGIVIGRPIPLLVEPSQNGYKIKRQLDLCRHCNNKVIDHMSGFRFTDSPFVKHLKGVVKR